MSAHVVDKRTIDLIVQAAIAGPIDGVTWTRSDERFSWYHDDRRHEVNPSAEVGDERNGREVVTPSQMGQRFVDECIRSVIHNYPEADPDIGAMPGPCDAYYMGPYIFESVEPGRTAAVVAPATIAEIAKQIAYYEYQSCEHDEWEDSEVCAICRAMKDALLEALPGYAEARWG